MGVVPMQFQRIHQEHLYTSWRIGSTLSYDNQQLKGGMYIKHYSKQRDTITSKKFLLSWIYIKTDDDNVSLPLNLTLNYSQQLTSILYQDILFFFLKKGIFQQLSDSRNMFRSIFSFKLTSSDNSTSRKLLVSFHLLVSFDLFFISLHFRTISCYGPDVCSDSSFCSSILMFVDKCVCLSLNTCLSNVMLDIISVSQ